MLNDHYLTDPDVDRMESSASSPYLCRQTIYGNFVFTRKKTHTHLPLDLGCVQSMAELNAFLNYLKFPKFPCSSVLDPTPQTPFLCIQGTIVLVRFFFGFFHSLFRYVMVCTYLAVKTEFSRFGWDRISPIGKMKICVDISSEILIKSQFEYHRIETVQ